VTDETPPKRRRLVDTTPLRVSPAYARLWFGGAISGIGAQLTVVAVGLQVYDITGSTLAVALVGGIALIPLVVAGLWGGMIADASPGTTPGFPPARCRCGRSTCSPR
jgi:hypothetical protein